jgi:hypothetical protein
VTNLNSITWKRTLIVCALGAERVTRVAAADVAAMAVSEGAGKQLAVSRVKRVVGFTSPVATYEPLKPGHDGFGITRYDGAWSVR